MERSTNVLMIISLLLLIRGSEASFDFPCTYTVDPDGAGVGIFPNLLSVFNYIYADVNQTNDVVICLAPKTHSITGASFPNIEGDLGSLKIVGDSSGLSLITGLSANGIQWYSNTTNSTLTVKTVNFNSCGSQDNMLLEIYTVDAYYYNCTFTNSVNGDSTWNSFLDLNAYSNQFYNCSFVGPKTGVRNIFYSYFYKCTFNGVFNPIYSFSDFKYYQFDATLDFHYTDFINCAKPVINRDKYFIKMKLSYNNFINSDIALTLLPASSSVTVELNIYSNVFQNNNISILANGFSDSNSMYVEYTEFNNVGQAVSVLQRTCGESAFCDYTQNYNTIRDSESLTKSIFAFDNMGVSFWDSEIINNRGSIISLSRSKMEFDYSNIFENNMPGQNEKNGMINCTKSSIIAEEELTFIDQNLDEFPLISCVSTDCDTLDLEDPVPCPAPPATPDEIKKEGGNVFVKKHLYVIPVVLGFLILVALLVLLIYRTKGKTVIVTPPPSSSSSPLTPLREEAQYVKTSEIQLQTIHHLTNITVEQKLGGGNFGEVYLGKWNGTKVALKKLKNEQDYISFKKESSILFELGAHPAVVQFLGMYATDKGEYFIVTEFVPKGDLASYIKENHNSIGFKDQIDMIVSGATGMAFLESKKVIHRDLAARNMLVKQEENQYSLKISDFGMSRSATNEYYKPSEDTAIPVRWSAPEVLKYAKFSHASDVWAFGVVMWEILELGALPYNWLSNKEVSIKVVSGEERLPRPQTCDDELWDILNQCFSEAEKRPTFEKLVNQLISYETNKFTVKRKDTWEDEGITYESEDHYRVVTVNASKKEEKEPELDLSDAIELKGYDSISMVVDDLKQEEESKGRYTNFSETNPTYQNSQQIQ